jgi:hypothetical protein
MKMWDHVEKISGLPPFRLSSCGDAVAVQDKLSIAKYDLSETLRQLELANAELSRAKTSHAE